MRVERGFTLLEMVVAIGIFAVIAAISYGTLSQFIDNRELLAQKNEELRRLQTAMMLLELDLRYAVKRPVRDGYGDAEAALISGSSVELAPGELLRLTASQPRALSRQAQRLQRVAWRVNDGKLSRFTWEVLDRDQDSKEFERVLLDGVAEVTFSFLTYNESNQLESKTEWLEQEEIPAGIEVLITVESGIQYRRLIEMATGA